MHRQKSSGFSLLELLISITIVVLLASFGIPNMLFLRQALVLNGAISQTQATMKMARALALQQRKNVTVKMQTGKHWWIGVTQASDCDCHSSDPCQINGIKQCIDAFDYPNVVLSRASFNQNKTVFEHVRGHTIGSAGTATFSSDKLVAKVVLSKIGRARICMQAGQLQSYPSC